MNSSYKSAVSALRPASPISRVALAHSLAARSSGSASFDKLPLGVHLANSTSSSVDGTVFFKQSGSSTFACPTPVSSACW